MTKMIEWKTEKKPIKRYALEINLLHVRSKILNDLVWYRRWTFFLCGGINYLPIYTKIGVKTQLV